MIRVAVLGSTGSIGRSALAVIERHPRRFRVVALAANRRADVLADQVARHRPEVAVLCDEGIPLPGSADAGRTRWRVGRHALVEIAASEGVDVVLNALVGAAGLRPTMEALRAGHRLALANKESLVAGGDLVLEAARGASAEIVPIDSEHSAILQCLQGHDAASVQRIVLTASGGPFRGRNASELSDVGPGEALRHPTWDMGAKITIDSATLANKALEVIEAHHLYGLEYDAIEAVVHPQSIIHSFVEFVDGSVLAQLGFPNMELPILYALSYPERVGDTTLRTYDPVGSSPLTFEDIDHAAFPMFGLGVEAGRRGGAAPAVYNAGNEIAVRAFLRERIGFSEIPMVVEETLERVGDAEASDIDAVIAADGEARVVAEEVAAKLAEARTGKIL